MTFKYRHGVLGGTFDHLHLGHKDLLDTAFAQSKKVTIGLATEKIYSRKFLAHLIEPFTQRESELNNYFKDQNYIHRSEIVALNDIYGPTLENNDIGAIFVTDSTLPNALLINKERENKNLRPFDIINVPLKKDETGEVITSERIRLGQIDRQGHVFLNVFKNKNELILPSQLRNELRHPIGEVIKDVEKIKVLKSDKSLLITVGDIVTKSLTDIGCLPDLQIIDFKTRRHIIDKKALQEITSKNLKSFRNDPGKIEKEIVINFQQEIQNLLDQKSRNIKIIIDGEEDLLTLPVVLLAPLGSFVCYGQFDLKAVVLVEVTEENKQFIFSLLKKFK